MSGSSNITQAVAEFTGWATSWPRQLSAGLKIVLNSCCAEEIQLFIVSSKNEIIEHHFNERDGYTSQASPSSPNWKAPYDLQLDILSEGINFHTTSDSHGYLLVLKGECSGGDNCYLFILKSKNQIAYSDGEEVFIQMTAPQLAHIATQSNRRKSALSLTEEAMEAIDDGVIIYDKNDCLVLYNSRYKDMFPSVATSLEHGVSYESLVREQAKNNPVHGDEEQLENWVSQRKKQLHQHRYQEEQKFASGQTFRLTNYKLESGGTISIRNDITELVEARKAAENSEKLFKTLLDGAPVALAVTMNQKVLFANELMHHLLEAKNGALIDTDTKLYFDDIKDHQEITQRLLETKVLMGHIMTIRTAKGNPLVVSVTGSHITYHGKRALFYSAVDVTESHKNREALKRSEKQKRDILELLPDALLVQGDGKIVYANKGAQRVLGARSIDELLGMDGLDILPDDQRKEILQLREQALANENSVSQRSRHKRLNGKEFHSEIYTTAINWDGKQSTLNVIKDISRNHQYEEQLRKNEQEMLLAQHIGNFGHWRLQVRTEQIIWSKALYDLHGLPHNTPITHELISSMITAAERTRLLEIIAEATETKEITYYEFEATLPDKSTKRIFAGSLLAEFGTHGEVTSIFGILEDVTDRRAMEEQLRQSQKMEAIGQLTGGVAHDFNNLLAIILGNAELIEDELPEIDHPLQKHAGSIVKAATRGAELVSSMLAFSRSQQLRPERTFLNISVAPLLDVLKRTIEENINIAITLEKDVWPCVADVGQVENALLNLSLNSRDAMPNGGDLNITIENSRLRDGIQTPIDEIPIGDYVKLTVQDTGIGIPKSKLKQVFDPFFTTKEVGKGTGLGLSMVYGFIRQSNGFVNIQSEPNRGTIVELYLPRDYSDVSALET